METLICWNLLSETFVLHTLSIIITSMLQLWREVTGDAVSPITLISIASHNYSHTYIVDYSKLTQSMYCWTAKSAVFSSGLMVLNSCNTCWLRNNYIRRIDNNHNVSRKRPDSKERNVALAISIILWTQANLR